VFNLRRLMVLRAAANTIPVSVVHLILGSRPISMFARVMRTLLPKVWTVVTIRFHDCLSCLRHPEEFQQRTASYR